MIDNGSHVSEILAKTECIGYPEDEAYFPRQEAAWRVVKHHDTMASAHQGQTFGVPAFDHGMRSALTFMLTGQRVKCDVPDAANSCVYTRDRVCVPRDMTVHAAKRFRWALTETAKEGGADPNAAKMVIIDKRMDQSAIPFVGDI
jgi:glutathione S-transferase